MTRALNKLVYGETSINSPHYPDQLSAEIRNTAEEIRTGDTDPETALHIARAVDILVRTEIPSFQKLYPVMEATAVTNNPELFETAREVLHSTYPIDESVDPDIRERNATSRREFHMALNRTTTYRNFGKALINAELLLDTRNKSDFERSLSISDLLMQKQDGKISPQDETLLNGLLEYRRRQEEYRKLEELGVMNDKQFDDAIRYTHSFDDEDETLAA